MGSLAASLTSLRRWPALLRGFRPGALSGVLLRGSALALTAHVGTMAVVFVSQIALARWLGADNFGVYVLANTWVTLLCMPAKLGLDTGCVRLLPEYRSTRRSGLLRGLLRSAPRWTLTAGALTGCLLAIGAWLSSGSIEPPLTAALFVAAVLLPLQAWLLVQQGILRGLKRVAWTRIPTALQSVGLLLGCLLWLAWAPLTPAGVMLVTVAATLVAAGVSSLRARTSLRPEEILAQPEYQPATWLRICLPLMYLAGMRLIFDRLDLLMLGAMLDSSQAGIYSAAVRLAALLAVPVDAVTSLAGPMMSEMHAAGRKQRLQRLVTLTALAAGGSVAVGTAMIVGGGPYLLGLFGGEFISAQPAVLLLAIGCLFSAFLGPVALLMSMTGHQMETAKIWTLAAVLNVVLNYLLIPRYGIEGAAAATALTLFFWKGCLIFRVKKLLGIRCGIWAVYSLWRERGR